jgi:hypothetical protein
MVVQGYGILDKYIIFILEVTELVINGKVKTSGTSPVAQYKKSLKKCKK